MVERLLRSPPLVVGRDGNGLDLDRVQVVPGLDPFPDAGFRSDQDPAGLKMLDPDPYSTDLGPKWIPTILLGF